MASRRIGLVMYGNGSYVNDAYVNYFSQFGTIVPISPIDDMINTTIDLLVLPGGRDVSIHRQPDVVPHFETGASDPGLEWFDVNMFSLYREAGIPVFGICRGMQSSWVSEGGIMVQHVNLPKSDPRWKLVEDMKIENDKLNFKFSPKKIKINSIHHQVIDMKTSVPDDTFTVVGKSTQYGNVEAIQHNHRPEFYVQYHPEEFNCPFATTAIKYLLTKSPRNVNEYQFTEGYNRS